MSLLTICTQAAQSARILPPPSIVGNTSETALLLLALANDEGEALARRKPGGWAAMNTEFTFTTAAIATTGTLNASNSITSVANVTGITENTWQLVSSGGYPNNTIVTNVSGSTVTVNQSTENTGSNQPLTFGQSDYALPVDYQRPIDGTFWDRSRFWQMRGALSPQQWQLYKSSVLGTSATIQRRYRIRNVANMLYLSIDPVPTDNDSTLVWEYVSNAWCASSLGVRQTQWMADTDIGVLDEFLIRKGVQWRLLERLGMAYDVAQAEYEELCDKAVAHDAGTQILELVKTSGVTLVGPWNVPETGFGH